MKHVGNRIHLTPFEKRVRNEEIVRLREQGLLLREVGAMFGLSSERTRQLEAVGLKARRIAQEARS